MKNIERFLNKNIDKLLMDDKKSRNIFSTLLEFSKIIESENTFRMYVYNLVEFEIWLAKISHSIFFSPGKINKEVLDNYYVFISGLGRKYHTIKQIRSSIYRLNQFQASKKSVSLYSRKTMFFVNKKRNDEVRTKGLNDYQLEVFFRWLGRYTMPVKTYIELTYYTGARVSEMIDLRPMDIVKKKLGDKTYYEIETDVFKKRKTNKYIISETIYNKILDLGITDPATPIFNYSSKYIQKVIKEIFTKMGLHKHSSHSLRATRIKQIAMKTTSVHAQKFVNHSNIYTTLRYIDVDQSELVDLIASE